jgi:hypothetical protein
MSSNSWKENTMGNSSRDDIRKLLKTFGIEADEKIVTFLARSTASKPLHLRITLDDLTDYGDDPPHEKLHLEIEGQVG